MTFRLFYTDYSENKTLEAVDAKVTTLNEVIRSMNSVLHIPGNFLGVIDRNEVTLQFLVEETGMICIDIPIPDKNGSLSKIADLAECIEIISNLNEVVLLEKINDLEFLSWGNAATDGGEEGLEPGQIEDWEEVKSMLKPHMRMAWFPEVVEKSSGLTASKFSGIPALLKSESWPCCDNCKEPMQLFLQLNSQDLPESAKNTFGAGLLQVFYCTNWDKECEVECEAFFPFSNSTLVRVVNDKTEHISAPEQSPVKEAFLEKEIIGWRSMEDFPHWEELENEGINLSDKQTDLLCELDYPKPKDKLLGWPHWVQGVEYPDCPECGKTMKLVFQIDSEDNLPYMFGDVGCSHITQCEDHKDQLAIAWACC